MSKTIRTLRSDEEFFRGMVRIQNINYPLAQFLSELTSYNSIAAFCKDMDCSENLVIVAMLELATIVNSNEFKDIIIGSQEMGASWSDDYKVIEYAPPK